MVSHHTPPPPPDSLPPPPSPHSRPSDPGIGIKEGWGRKEGWLAGAFFVAVFAGILGTTIYQGSSDTPHGESMKEAATATFKKAGYELTKVTEEGKQYKGQYINASLAKDGEEWYGRVSCYSRSCRVDYAYKR